ncbi:uncharacterized protein LOC134781362 isoform X2 [Penaeus indicus]|uniref:uncharacterized protein LOC134781362 isoform X2 n=1 Tax=Penaeus indicus TaxID=29960 RepID=UPI00300CBFFF
MEHWDIMPCQCPEQQGKLSTQNINDFKTSIQDKENVNAPLEEGSLTMLHHACRFNKADEVQRLLSFPDLHLNLLDSDGWTPLMWAASEGSTDCVRQLVNAKGKCVINLRTKGRSGFNAFRLACKKSHWDVANVLLPHLLPHDKFDDGRLLPKLEAKLDDELALETLCGSLLKLRSLGNNVDTAVLNATLFLASEKEVEVVEFLIETYTFDVLILNEALLEAAGSCWSSGSSVVRALLRKFEFQGDVLVRAKSLAEACSHDDVVDLLEHMATHGVLPDIEHDSQEFIPCRCPQSEDLEYPDYKLRKTIHQVGPTNLQCLLDAACFANNISVVKMLLNHRHIHLNFRDQKGYTPLMAAAQEGFSEVVNAMTLSSTRCGLNICASLNSGENAFTLAYAEKEWKTMGLLLHKCDREATADKQLIQVLAQSNLGILRSQLRTQTYSPSALLGGLFSALFLRNSEAAMELLHYQSFDLQRLCIVATVAAMDGQWGAVKAVTDILEKGDLSGRQISQLEVVLWEAVRANEVAMVRVLSDILRVNPRTAVTGRPTTSEQEAHTRGHTDVVATFNKNAPPAKLTAEEQQIIRAMELHGRRVKDLFVAVWAGQIEDVNKILSSRSDVSISLPGFVRDIWGATLPHVLIAGMEICTQDPVWVRSNEVESLIREHRLYTNSVDCKGRTALHLLAEGRFWDRRYQKDTVSQMSVVAGWEDPFVERAQMALRAGVDPRLRDHRGQSPQEIALDKDRLSLAKTLGDKCEELGPLETPEEKDLSGNFAKMLVAASMGNVEQTMFLLQERVPLEPRDGYSGPLHLALTRGQRDVMMLLLAGGAPITATSSDGLTILEAAHRTPDLPALFPAIIREEYVRGIFEEINSIEEDSEEKKLLKAGLLELLKEVQRRGHRTSWPEEYNLGDNWSLLTTAARLGLPLASHFLVQGGARTDLIPNDRYHPLAAAFESSEQHMMVTLCRDLQIMPYHVPKLRENNLPHGLLKHLLKKEEDILYELMLKEKRRASMVQEFLEYLSDLQSSKQLRHPSTSAMCLIGELGMVHTLHAITKQVKVDLEVELEPGSKSRLIHIAAQRGHKPLLEYLVRSDVQTDIAVSGDMMPAHLAALMGHSTCLKYLRHFPGESAQSAVGMTPDDILQAHNDYVKSVHLNLVSDWEEDKIMNESRTEVSTRVLLRGKCVRLGITSPATLRQCALDKKVDFSDSHNCHMKITIEKEMKRLCEAIARADSRYKGHIVNVGSVAENVRMLLPDEMDFNLQLDSYDGFKEGKVTVNVEQKPKSCKRLDNTDDEVKISVQCKEDPELFRGSNFLDYFEKAVRKALQTFSFESPNLSIIYPGIEMTKVGLALFVTWSEKRNGPLVLMPSIDLVPAIGVPWPENNCFSQLPEHIQEVAKNVPVSITCCGDNSWRYSLSEVEAEILSSITDEQRVVILACKLLCSLLKADWWYPKKYRNHYMVWDHVYLKLNVPVSYIIKTLFIKELSSQTKEESWNNENFMERVMSIFRGMVLISEDKEVIRADKVPSFLLPNFESQRFGDGAPTIIKFLEDLAAGKICNVEKETLPQPLHIYGKEEFETFEEDNIHTVVKPVEQHYVCPEYENTNDFDKIEVSSSEDEDFDPYG